MNANDFLPLFVDLTNKFPELIFWKHFDRGINGLGDIDTIAPQHLLNNISSEFIKLTLANIPDAIAIVECRYSVNVRPHFVLSTKDFPTLFQFDISYNPMRFGVFWCDPAKLTPFSMINDLGVRILRPGALAIVLFLLNGLSRHGTNTLKPYDYKDIIDGLRNDKTTAISFVEWVIPVQFQNLLIDLIYELNKKDWSVYYTKRLWWAFVRKSAINHLISDQVSWMKSINRLRIAQSRKHHHPRVVSVENIDLYLKAMHHEKHVITIRLNEFELPFAETSKNQNDALTH